MAGARLEMVPDPTRWRPDGLAGVAAVLAAAALALMALVPVVELAWRPWHGSGIENAPVLVQHLGLVLAMAGAVVAERGGHLITFGGAGGIGGLASRTDRPGRCGWPLLAARAAQAGAAITCGLLAQASWQFVASEIGHTPALAYGMPIWWVQLVLPAGFGWLAVALARRAGQASRLPAAGLVAAVALPALGWWAAGALEGRAVPLLPALALPLGLLLLGAPVFAVLGALALGLFASDALPLASVALSHYQITVNPSLPALPLFTLAGLVLARSGAAQRLGVLFVALFGGGGSGTVLAAALLCSAFTALTGGSGVTILALGGLLLPLLRDAGYPEQRGIGLVTSASALGVLLAPSVPMIMVAVIARIPIGDMFLAGMLPALLMVACLLTIGGFLRRGTSHPAIQSPRLPLRQAAWQARWELLTPVVALGSLLSGMATPTESAALTAVHAVATQSLAHRELGWRGLVRCLVECAQIIGGVMLVLGMALALTNFLVDAGVPDAAATWVQVAIPDRHAFLLALCLFLFVAAALMEIYAAIVVLVPLLLPVAALYGIEPLHFGILFLAAMEAGFLCPPAGMNIYFASAMFNKPIRDVAAAVLPALAAIFIGTLLIALVPSLVTGLPSLMRGAR